MANAQKWTRNLSKKIKKAGLPRTPGIINNDPLEALKRRAEDFGLIIHAQRGGALPQSTKKKGGQK